MVSGNTHFFRFLIAGLLIALFWGCQRKPDLQVNETISCDLEQVTEDGKSFISDSHPGEFFNGADKRSGDEARSGKYSILLRNGRAFGLDFRLGNVSADEYYRVSIWRKGNVDKGFINVGDKDGKYFYKATEEHDSVGADGWKRLSLTFHVPPNLNNATLKIYAWNPNDDSIYYDDISISRLTPKEYPAYEGITGLKLFIDTLNTFKLAEKRKQAFDNFILATEDDDWVEGMFFYGEGMYRTDLRLKGDWLDHLLGAKWSFRIEVKDNQTWNGMRTFSVQNPESRDFLNEWLMHEFCRDHDILATRYGFTPLSLNNKSLGIYAWEEHFEKYLVESNNRREGPILKVNEDAL
ncbi:MAG TPA: CotH kinase family protein, partial [Bacteroidales bacterium]|nr:CotH kinase family protein [Bacteroidales bacterium]